MTSGWSRPARTTACSPFSASPTNSRSGLTLRNALNPERTTAWSSTSMTRILSDIKVLLKEMRAT